MAPSLVKAVIVKTETHINLTRESEDHARGILERPSTPEPQWPDRTQWSPNPSLPDTNQVNVRLRSMTLNYNDDDNAKNVTIQLNIRPQTALATPPKTTEKARASGSDARRRRVVINLTEDGDPFSDHEYDQTPPTPTRAPKRQSQVPSPGSLGSSSRPIVISSSPKPIARPQTPPPRVAAVASSSRAGPRPLGSPPETPLKRGIIAAAPETPSSKRVKSERSPTLGIFDGNGAFLSQVATRAASPRSPTRPDRHLPPQAAAAAEVKQEQPPPPPPPPPPPAPALNVIVPNQENNRFWDIPKPNPEDYDKKYGWLDGELAEQDVAYPQLPAPPQEAAEFTMETIWAAHHGLMPLPEHGLVCGGCGQPSTLKRTTDNNPNGNIQRPYYKCTPCDSWFTWADVVGVDEGNAPCYCNTPSRVNVTGVNARSGPGRRYRSCATGRCGYWSWDS